MTRSTKLLIPAIAAIAAVAAFYFLVLSPKREEVAQLETQIAAKQTAADTARAQAESYLASKADYRKNYSTMTRLGKAVTGDDDVRSLLVQLNDAAGRADVDFHTLNVGATGGTPAASTPGVPAPPPGAVAIGTAGFSAMPFNFGFEGSFFKLSDFFNHLEDFVTVTNKDVDVTGRLVLVGSIAIQPKSDLKHMSAQIGAATYLAPPATDINGAPAPAAATGQGATPSTDGGVTPTTTATITGVR